MGGKTILEDWFAPTMGPMVMPTIGDGLDGVLRLMLCATGAMLIL